MKYANNKSKNKMEKRRKIGNERYAKEKQKKCKKIKK